MSLFQKRKQAAATAAQQAATMGKKGKKQNEPDYIYWLTLLLLTQVANPFKGSLAEI